MNINLREQDQLHRQRALDPSKSFTVSAPAGSGKTELLIQRFLTLLQQVESPQEILAITFTKKAANEMRERIMNALKNAYKEEKPDSIHQQITWRLAKKVLEKNDKLQWNLMNNPNQLRIQTIDSLCAYLTQNLPLLSHFGSPARIADHPFFLYREAVQEVLLHIEENFSWTNAIAELFLHLDNDLNKLQNLLISLLAKRDQWLPYLSLDLNDHAIRDQLEHHLQSVISESLQKIKKLFPHEVASELLDILRFAALYSTEPSISSAKDLPRLPGVLSSDKECWQIISAFLLTKNFAWRKRLDVTIGFPPLASLKNLAEHTLHSEYRDRFKELINLFMDHEELRLAFKELSTLPTAKYKDDEWKILQALLQVLTITVAQLRVVFQEHGQIDFIENTQGALSALGDAESPTDLALALDYQIRHILMDEFQDTSFTQYQLLKKLTLGWEENDGRTLFIVGDPMQSIYRFRCAEVSLFLHVREKGLGNIQLIPLTLSVNFRSRASLVSWNNFIFQNIFPVQNDITHGAILYNPSIALPEKTNDAIIEIKEFLEGDDTIQANTLVTLISDLKKQYPQESIAILVRSRSHLSAILPALKAEKIAYSAVDIDPLIKRQYIQDLMSLTKALLHLADRISWLALLRSPLCGLTLNDLWILAHEDANVLLWEKMLNEEMFKRLSTDGQNRLNKILPILKNKLFECERENLSSWIENTWLLLGGPATLPHLEAMDDIRSFFNLLDECNTPILNLNHLSEKLHQLYASSRLDDSLQIMTIHAAKGLEFNTVILPHLELKNAMDDKPLLSWMEQPLKDGTMALLLAPIHAIGDNKNPIYEYIIRQHKIKSDYETDRLLYVATTRASKRLFLFYNRKEKENGLIKTESGSFLQKIYLSLAQQTNSLTRVESAPILTEKAQDNQRPIYRLHSSWTNSIIEKAKTTETIHQKKNGFLLKEHKYLLIGTIIHAVLQRISQTGLDWWQNHKNTIQTEYLTRQIIQHGIVNDIASTVSLIQKIIHNALEDTRGRWILASHKESKSELAITSLVDNQFNNLIIDRTFVDENDIRWIIDYKTTSFFAADDVHSSSTNLEIFLEDEKRKYSQKMNQYKQAIRLMDQRPIRMGLYFPSIPAWKEWE